MQSHLGEILHQQQIKVLISKIVQIDITDYAGPLWLMQHQSLQKLNLQLHVDALMKNDQYFLEQCIVQDKFKILIYDLIMTATWKQKVFPMIKEDVAKMSSIKVYLAIYHEVVVGNILEVVMYHRTAIQESGEFLIQIIDYCYKKISKQVADSIRKRKIEREEEKNKIKLTEEQKKQIKIKNILNRTPLEEINRQFDEIQFSLSMLSISILRYVTDYIKHLQIGILHHILIQCNIFSLLVPLIEERPWMRTNEKGEREIYQGYKWNVVPKSQYGKLSKIEAQVWIALYNMFMNPECRKKYELNDQRKSTLLRLRKYLNQVLLDQIPPLSHMLRSLQELSLMNVPTHLSVSPFVIQQMPIIASSIAKNVDWKQLSIMHLKRLDQKNDAADKKILQKMADLYTNNNVEGILQGFKCNKCGKQAFKRCSKCKSVWFCSRECQVADWPNHKAKCNQKAKELQQKAKQQQKKQVQFVAKKPTIDELD